MPYINGIEDILKSTFRNIINELYVYEEDFKTLKDNNIILRDINPSNTIYNGSMYLIDPGNYLIDQLRKVIPYVEIETYSKSEKEELLDKWNQDKINKLLDILLFNSVDSYTYRKIVQFFKKEREENGYKLNLYIFLKYFDLDLPILESIKKFIDSNIDYNDEQERELFLSLYGK